MSLRKQKIKQVSFGVLIFMLGLLVGYLSQLHYTLRTPSSGVFWPSKHSTFHSLSSFFNRSFRRQQPIGNNKNSSELILGDELDSMTSCDPLDDPHEELAKYYGRDVLMLGRGYEGSGIRARKLLTSLRKGRPIKIGVIGGSVSFGHGVPKHEQEQIYSKRLLSWIQREFPTTDGEEHQLINGAVPGSSVIYFSFCYKEHIPADLDLVLVELDINSWHDTESMLALEHLYQSLLSLPSQPAIFYISVNALRNGDIAAGSPTTLPVSEYFDIPVFSVRNMILSLIMNNPSKSALSWFFGNPSGPESALDKLHMNHNGHRAAADLIILYLRKQDCELNRRNLNPALWQQRSDLIWSREHSLGQVPRLSLLDPWSTGDAPRKLFPNCSTVYSASQPLKPVQMSDGFQHVVIYDKAFYATERINSSITFEARVEVGQIGLLHWVTPDKDFGSLRCCIDENWQTSERVVHGHSNFGLSYLGHSGMLWTDLRPGIHTINCQSFQNPEHGGQKFRLVGLTYA